ncbi:MAG TPA: proton-conducting transporter membrane subunit [Gemmataceae bacterium]|jgi:NAD(P)H-quinone oxidoreductase subunit 5|nr:proton-conducting transporter membrane subunit [Gemmataceae bacterium]
MLTWLGVVVVVAPLLLVGLLGASSLLGWRLPERTVSRAILAAVVSGLAAAVAVLAGMLITGRRHVVIDGGEWVHLPHFHFAVKFVFDRLSVPFAILSFVLSGTIAAFATRYMHREAGYNRFFVLYSLFVLGMVVTALADTIETLFAGWELVGLSSALLVAFYQERPAPARNGLWVWVVYRVSDAALLLAAVVLHQTAAGGDFDKLLGPGPWPEGQADVTARQALVVGLLLLVAAAGKSGLVPFSGWLPRAMEGPTPSSAIFYGALSVHLGAFLMMRVSPLLERSAWLCAAVVALGLGTALFAYLAGSVQTDVKSALSFACLTQVGLIFAEVGLGLRYVALVHLLGHACLRTLQFVRAPTLLHDYHTLENAIGEHLPRRTGPVGRVVGEAARAWLYRLALGRGHLDAWLTVYAVAPFVRLLRWCGSAERGWTEFLTGQPSRAPDEAKPYPATFEDVI